MTAQAMIIRCKQKRKGGSDITMADGSIIAFRPDDNGDHVAMVANPDHIQRLLSITEGYQIHSVAAAPAANGPVLGGLNSAPVKIVATQTAPTLPPNEPNTGVKPDAPVGSTEPQTNTGQTDTWKPAGEATTADDAKMNALREMFEKEVGRKPHPNSKAETMLAQITAIREEKANK